MTKIKKQRKRKVYRYNINRKRLRNRICKLDNINCKEIKNVWERKKSVETNLKEMGLSNDPNKTLKIESTKSKLLKVSLLSNKQEWDEEIVDTSKVNKLHIVDTLEADAKAPRERKFRLPKSQVEWITYLMSKYKSDYKAMARDAKNYNQETWKQIRQKIKRFKKIPEQYGLYLKQNGLEASDDDSNVSDEEL